ncbi:MAG: peptide chain release factor N(5)-glutamine methyltransferase [Vicinamibacterales bacterium]
MPTIRELMIGVRARLAAAGIPVEEAALDAEVLARHVLGWSRADLLAREAEAPPPAFAAAYDRLAARRERREPVAYIRGTQEFWGREFLVSPAVLIPRPETELIVEAAMDFLGAPLAPGAPDGTDVLRVVDIGTGSGCLAITLALEYPALHVVATDISAEALDVARANAARHGVADRVTFLHAPYFGGVLAPVDLVVSNPPYVADDEPLPPEVGGHEPPAALYGGADGLRDVREILAQAAGRLAPSGRLLVEIGYGQADAVRRAVAHAEGLALVRFINDLQGIPRVADVSRQPAA